MARDGESGRDPDEATMIDSVARRESTRSFLRAAALAIVAAGSLLAGAQARQAAAPPQRTVVFLGDSLAAGYGLDPAQAFPAIVGERIRDRGWPFRVVNAGVSGETSAGGLRRVNWLLRQQVDVLVLELGANDALRGLRLEDTERNLEAIVERVRAGSPGVEIVLAGMLAPPNLGPEYAEHFRSLYRRLAERQRLHLVPFLLEGVGGRPELNLPDGIHPTPAGHRIVADNVWRVLEGVLEQLAAG
jgi:acyl-CoA thioesterase-1